GSCASPANRSPARGPSGSAAWYAMRPAGGRAVGSGAGGEGRGVLDRREGGALGVVVGLDRAGADVGDGEGHLDVGEAAREDPEVVEERAGVEHLDDQLDVRGGEEPEVTAVAGEAHRRAVAAAAVTGAPGRTHAEAAAVETEIAGALRTRGGVRREGEVGGQDQRPVAERAAA